MAKIARSFKMEKAILDGIESVATRENRTNNNFVETALAIIVAILEKNPELELKDLIENDEEVTKLFEKLTSPEE